MDACPGADEQPCSAEIGPHSEDCDYLLSLAGQNLRRSLASVPSDGLESENERTGKVAFSVIVVDFGRRFRFFSLLRVALG